MWSFQNNHVFLRPLNASSSVLSPDPHPSTTPPLDPEPVLLAAVRGPSSGPSAAARLGTMKLAALLGLCCVLRLSGCAPPTCYSRALGLSKEVMTLLDKIHTSERTKTCAEVLPTIFLDVHNSCVTSKLRDFLYVVLNHPDQSCRKRPRMMLLKRKVQNLYTIITRLCYRDLVFFMDDCEAIDTGHGTPHYTEDRLQLLEER